MDKLFFEVLNRSIAAGWLILAVLVLRLLLKKAPKWVHVVLWGLVAVRLCCPFSLESAVSLIPSRHTVSPEMLLEPSPQIHSGSAYINGIINPMLEGSNIPAPGASINPLQITFAFYEAIWVLGMGLMGLYTLVSYWALRRRVRTAVRLRENRFQSENVPSPFVLGLVKPRIYLPYGIDERDLSHIIAHEEAHIRRRDHWWKPLGFLLLTIHWFNPLMWLAYALLCRDIELACDERVIRELGMEARADYSQALLKCSIRRRSIAACPLAFGEVGVKERIKSVLSYRKPTFWLILAAVAVCIGVGVCFLTDPPDITGDESLYYYGFVTTQTKVCEDSILTVACDDGQELEFYCPAHLISLPMQHQRVWVRAQKEASGQLTASKVSITTNRWADNLSDAICGAIVDCNWHGADLDKFHSAAFAQLAQTVTGENLENVTVYGLAMHISFARAADSLEESGGSYGPVVLHFRISPEGTYLLTEYWEPRDGAYYTKDIRAKFPDGLWPDDEAHRDELLQDCYQQAARHFGVDPGDIAPLDWASTIDRWLLDYGDGLVQHQEVLYQVLAQHKTQSLRYLYNQFLTGSPTGERADVMAQLSYRLARDLGEEVQVPISDAISGQLWFDLFRTNAVDNLAKQHTFAQLERLYPASMLLLWMIDPDAKWNVLDKALMDLDGDGKAEYCTLRREQTSGINAVGLTARRDDWTGPVQYETIQLLKDGSVRFVGTASGPALEVLSESGITYTYHILLDDTREGQLLLSEPVASPDWGLSLQVKDVSPLGLTLICHQSGGAVTGILSTQVPTSLEVWENGQWTALEPQVTVLWKYDPVPLSLEQTTEVRCDWGNEYGRLEPGLYRLGKVFSDCRTEDDGDEATLYAVFEIQ